MTGKGWPKGTVWGSAPRDGSDPTQLTHYSDDKFIVDFAWSYDGTQLAIARATIVNDVVVFSGFNPKR